MSKSQQEPSSPHANADPQQGGFEQLSAQEKANFKPPRPYLRLLIPAALGLVLGLLLPRSLPLELRLLAGWLVFAGGYLLATWWIFLRVSSAWIRHLASLEDNGRRTAGLLTTGASLISLVGVLSALSKATELSKGGHHNLELWLTGTAILSVVLSWLLIQTVYTLRYAHLYYGDAEGGIDFPSSDGKTEKEPDYLDFAYLSFTIGMTYQVSDTDITQKPMRMLLTGHALISYVFGVVIIAMSISVVGSLIS